VIAKALSLQPTPALAAAWSVYVPMASAGAADPALTPAPATLLADATLPDGASGADRDAGQPAQAEPEAFQYSDDPHLRKCQVASFQDHIEVACAQAKAEDDGGAVYDACVRDIDLRVRQCYAR